MHVCVVLMHPHLLVFVGSHMVQVNLGIRYVVRRLEANSGYMYLIATDAMHFSVTLISVAKFQVASK